MPDELDISAAGSERPGGVADHGKRRRTSRDLEYVLGAIYERSGPGRTCQ
jgi:hypothetical protein